MWDSLLGILFEGLKAWNDQQGISLYKEALKAKEEYDAQMDRKARTGKYSQLKVDRVLRDLRRISDTYYEFIKSNPINRT